MEGCAKCGADLIGSKRFCAACGFPAVDPKASSGSPQPPPIADPYAATALAEKLQKMQSEYGPPPSPGDTGPRRRTGTAEMPAVKEGPASSSPALSTDKSPPKAGALSPLASSNINPTDRPPAASSTPPQQALRPQASPPPQPPVAQPSAPPHVGLGPPTPQNPMAVNMFGSQVRPVASKAAPNPYPTGRGPQSQIASGAPPAWGAGALVYVQWADGNRYQGTVQQVSGTQCLVLFNNGQQQWIESRYLTSGT
jgi:hypothetical protein